MTPIQQSVLFSIDAETIGLYGEPFAVAYTVSDMEGKEIEHGYFACPSDSAQGLHTSREWIQINVVPHLPKETTHKNPQELCEVVYQTWMRVRKEYDSRLLAIGDCLYPVEASLFKKMIEANDLANRQWTGPFPFHEVDTALLMAGMKREDTPRSGNELPEHHPLSDARYSARLFRLATEKCRNIGATRLNQ